MKQIALHQWHIEHNKRVKEFHIQHEYKIINGKNGSNWLARWERFFYNKVILKIKNKKELFLNLLSASFQFINQFFSKLTLIVNCIVKLILQLVKWS